MYVFVYMWQKPIDYFSFCYQTAPESEHAIAKNIAKHGLTHFDLMRAIFERQAATGSQVVNPHTVSDSEDMQSSDESDAEDSSCDESNSNSSSDGGSSTSDESEREDGISPNDSASNLVSATLVNSSGSATSTRQANGTERTATVPPPSRRHYRGSSARSDLHTIGESVREVAHLMQINEPPQQPTVQPPVHPPAQLPDMSDRQLMMAVGKSLGKVLERFNGRFRNEQALWLRRSELPTYVKLFEKHLVLAEVFVGCDSVDVQAEMLQPLWQEGYTQ
jgi:hypothetical protein